MGRPALGPNDPRLPKRWQAAQVHRPQTVARVDSNLRCHVYPFFEDRPLTSISATEIQVRVEVWSVGKIRHSSEEDSAPRPSDLFRERSASTGRLDRATHPPGRRSAAITRPVEHVEALVAALPDRYQALVVFAAGTGLRQGEVFGLRLDRVEFLRHSVEVSSQLVDGLPAPLKTDASYRTVPLPATAAALSEHLRQFPVGVGGLGSASARRRPAPDSARAAGGRQRRCVPPPVPLSDLLRAALSAAEVGRLLRPPASAPGRPVLLCGFGDRTRGVGFSVRFRGSR